MTETSKSVMSFSGVIPLRKKKHLFTFWRRLPVFILLLLISPQFYLLLLCN
uniref:Uncharacterized protein n=1 Tax=Octopus bimaculoides TaxID=37653 RepID=A0A0L8HRX9_OCTBM